MERIPELNLEIVGEGFVATLQVQPKLDTQIIEAQEKDEEMQKIKKEIQGGKMSEFSLDEQGVLRFRNRLCVPDNKEIKGLILQEAHASQFSRHPGGTKMYRDLKKRFWWNNMKREIGEYVALCDICQRVKASHQKPTGLLQPLPVPEWKWEEIGMDFITGLPKTQRGYDAIWVIVDRFTKVAHFIPIKQTYGKNKLAELYLTKIVVLHGVPKRICSDRGAQFTSHFWRKLHKAMGTDLDFSTAYHPQSGG